MVFHLYMLPLPGYHERLRTDYNALLRKFVVISLLHTVVLHGWLNPNNVRLQTVSIIYQCIIKESLTLGVGTMRPLPALALQH